MVKIILSKVAKNDLREIYNYIKRDSVKYALLERKKIESVIDKLRHQPLLGKSTKFKNSPVYELVFQNYKIIYNIVNDSEINIFTIHHHARSISNNPAFSDND